jgi:WD40 repeat protein
MTGEQISFDYTNFMMGVGSLSWRANETQVVAASGGDWGLYMLDVATGKETFFPTLNPTISAQWHPNDPDMIAVIERDGSLRLWDVPQHKIINTFLLPETPIGGVVWSPDARLIAYFTANSFEILDVESEMIIMSFPIEKGGQVRDFSWSVDGKIFLAVTDHHLRAWDMETGQLLQEIILQIREPTATIGKIDDETYIIAYGGVGQNAHSSGLEFITFKRSYP